MKLFKTFSIVCLLGIGARLQAQPLPTAWVINTLGETLSQVDLGSGQVTPNSLTLGSAPNDIVISGTTGYVVNSLSNHLQVIDLENKQTIRTIEIFLGLNPYSIALDNNDRAYVSNLSTGSVSILDLVNGEEIDTINTGGAPEGVCVYEDILYVTDVNYVGPWTYGSGLVHAYSLPALGYLGTIQVGMNPQVIKPGPDGLLHIVCTGDFADVPGRIDLLDPQSLELVDSILVGGSPGALSFSPQGIGFLSAGGWIADGLVMTYDALNHNILHGEANPITVPSAATGIAATTAGNALVCCFVTDQVVEVDTAGNQIHSYDVGDGPLTLAVWEPPTGIPPEAKPGPDQRLAYNYPEPFNSTTWIIYSLPSPQNVSLSLFDLQGRLLERQSLGWRAAGEIRIPVTPASGISSGYLWYRLETRDASTDGSMLYLK